MINDKNGEIQITAKKGTCSEEIRQEHRLLLRACDSWKKQTDAEDHQHINAGKEKDQKQAAHNRNIERNFGWPRRDRVFEISYQG